jgi:hypothetical protein
MAYKSNFRDIPALAEHLLTERQGSEIEVRYTYNEPHIPADFAAAEYLDDDEWLWLREQLAPRLGKTVQLSMPPGVGEPKAPPPAVEQVSDAPPLPAPVVETNGTPPGFLPGRYGFKLIWDGTLEVRRVWGGSGPPQPSEVLLKSINVREIADPEAFLASLPI